MKPNPTRSALLVIDMENGFVEPEGGHCIRFAKSTVPACVRAVEAARRGLTAPATMLEAIRAHAQSPENPARAVCRVL